MKRVFVFIVFIALVAVAMAFGQQAGRGIISGNVRDSSNNEPVRKAIVALTFAPTAGAPAVWATGRTDDSGRFVFEKLPAGKYTLRAAKTGIGTAVWGANSTREIGEVIPLGDGEVRDGLALRFIRAAEIRGHVLDAEGDPLSGVNVQLLRTTRNLGERTLANYKQGSSDDRGEYLITNVDPGQYYLRANPGLVSNGVARDAFPAQYYGGLRDWKESTAINVRSGDNLQAIDFQLRAEQHYPIRGRVTGIPELRPAPKPPESGVFIPHDRTRQVDVRIGSATDGLQGTVIGNGARAPDYQFDFSNLPGDKYHLEASLRDGGKMWSAWEVIDSRQPLGEIALNLTSALDIKGTVKIEGEGGPPPTGLRIRLVRQDSRTTVVANPAADGSFTLSQVPQGAWAVNVDQMPPGAFLKSAGFDGKDVRFTRLPLEAASRSTLSIVVSTRAAKIEGEIAEGSGNSKRAGIVLAPRGALHDLARFYYGVVSDDDGKFKLQGIAPGKYKIFALEKLAPADFRNPEAADQLDALGEEIDLAEGATLQVHPKLIPTARARAALPDEARQ